MKIQGKNWNRTYLGTLVAVMLVMASLLFLDISANAQTVKMGTVYGINSGSSLNFRDTPGGTWIGALYNGDTGEIIDQTNSGGILWYKMTVNGKTGWASSEFIKVTEYTITEDKDFDAYLTAQGFPESYKAQLKALHNVYPNWVFEAQNTNLTWAEVIEAESALGKNLVYKDSINSWKSTQNGAYNWETGEWKWFDSGGWVMASKEMIEYAMDPRNFLDSTNIFQFIKQSYNANALNSSQLVQKKTDLTNMVKGTYLAGTCDGRAYVDVIMDAAAASGVCPFTLASMMIQEQGKNGTGNGISGDAYGYKGYYNYFSVGAFKTDTMEAVERGLWYASGSGRGETTYGRPWNTRTKSIMGGSKFYAEEYVSVGQDTLYLKKFNVQGNNKYWHQYMTNVQGAISEGRHIAEAYDSNARQSALVFKIPVYKNMPETACIKPTGDDNPNYMLKSLSVSGYSLTPTFSVYETSYSLIVPNNVSSVTVSAGAIAETTSVTGIGTKNLNVGTNVVTVTTKAQTGATRTYTINIVRQAAASSGGSGGTSTPSTVVSKPTSSSYDVNTNSTVSGIDTFPISVAEFAGKFSVTNGTVKVTTSNGTAKTGNVGTGDQVRVYDTSGTLKYTYDIIIYGDANGDGRVNAKDLLTIQKNNIRISSLSGVYTTAADVNRDGRVNAKDLLAVQKHNIKITSIQQ